MHRTTKSIGVLAVVALAVTAMVASLLGGAAGAKPRTSASGNIVETAAASGKFDTLLSLATQAGLAETLATGGPFTVFAPTDAAFAKVPKKTLRALGRDRDALRSVLLYHVAEGELRANRVVKRSRIETLNGAKVRVKVRRRTVKVNNARVVQANIDASNGVVHAINRVLIPPKR